MKQNTKDLITIFTGQAIGWSAFATLHSGMAPTVYEATGYALVFSWAALHLRNACQAKSTNSLAPR